MHVPPIADLDQVARQQFLKKTLRPLTIPDAILSEYRLRDPVMHTVYALQSPLVQYQAATGYEFPWGHILERRINQAVVWDFCLSHLLLQYLQAGMRLEDCQNRVFRALEQVVDCTTRDVVNLVGLAMTWQLCPGSSVGIFSQVTHFTVEQAAREWVATELLAVLPGIIASVQLHAVNNRQE